jgi:hypothetical protein
LRQNPFLPLWRSMDRSLVFIRTLEVHDRDLRVHGLSEALLAANGLAHLPQPPNTQAWCRHQSA